MKHISILLLVLTMAMLSACAAKQPTAEVVDRDGQRLVHVLGSNIMFPLLPGWNVDEEVHLGKTTVYAKDENGLVSGFLVGKPQTIGETIPSIVFQFGRMPEVAGEKSCARIGASHVSSRLLAPDVFFFKCIDENLSNHSGVLVEDFNENQILIQFYSPESTSKHHADEFVQMMQSIMRTKK